MFDFHLHRKAYVAGDSKKNENNLRSADIPVRRGFNVIRYSRQECPYSPVRAYFSRKLISLWILSLWILLNVCNAHAAGSAKQKHKDFQSLSGEFYELAWDFEMYGRFIEAADMCAKSIEAETLSVKPRTLKLITDFNLAGYFYLRAKRYNKAIEYYQAGSHISKNAGRKNDMVLFISKMGEVYTIAGDYDEAIKYFKTALANVRKLNDDHGTAVILCDIGDVYRLSGRYDNAIKYYEESLVVVKKLENQNFIANNLNNIGLVQYHKGHLDEAMRYYNEALVIANKLENDGIIANIHKNIGMVHYHRGQYEEAIYQLDEAVEIYTSLRNDHAGITLVNKIGQIYTELSQHENAIQYCEEATHIARKYGLEFTVAKSLNSIGAAHAFLSNYDKAAEYCKEALKIARKLPIENSMVIYLGNLGSIFYSSKSYTESVKSCEEALNILDRLAKSASEEDQRYYMSARLRIYPNLIPSYIQTGNTPEAFHTNELRLAMLSAETPVISVQDLFIPTIEQVQSELDENTAALIYTKSNRDNLAIIIITEDTTASIEVNTLEFIDTIFKRYEDKIVAQAVKVKQEKLAVESERKPDEIRSILGYVIDYYRSLLTTSLANPLIGITREESTGYSSAEFDIDKALFISRQLDKLFIKPTVKYIQNINDLIIVPVGELNSLPFESILDEKKSYFVEKHRIAYTQSFTALNLVKQRGFFPSSKPLLSLDRMEFDEVSLWQLDYDISVQYMATLSGLIEDEGYTYSEAFTKTKRDYISGKFDNNFLPPYYWAPYVYYCKQPGIEYGPEQEVEVAEKMTLTSRKTVSTTFKQQYEKCRIIYKQHHWMDSAHCFERLLQEDPNNDLSDNCQYWIGESYYLHGNYAQALIEFEHTLDFEDTNKRKDALIMQAKCRTMLNGMHIIDEADQPVVEEIPVSRYSKSIKVRYDRGLAHFNQRQYDKAVEIFQQILSENRSNYLSDNSQYWIGESYYQLKDYRKALNEFARILEFKNTNKIKDATFMMAKCHEKLNESNAALKIYRRILTEFPNYHHLNIVRWKVRTLEG